jgi:hypothetical protein
MTDVMELFDEFKRECKRARFADPRPFLAKASADDRPTLSALIDAYLEAAPPTPTDEAAYANSAAKRLVKALDQVAGESTGLWPRALPLLRKRAGLRRKDVVERLTKELDLEGGEDLVGAAFHEMESGFLDSEDVQTPVLEALGRMLGESADTLGSLGRRLGPARARIGPVSAFARRSDTAVHAPASRAREPQTVDPRRRRLERRVDDLFRGGGGRVE